MKTSFDEKNKMNEFHGFLKAKSLSVPSVAEDLIKGAIYQDLIPSEKQIFAKLFVTQGLVGTLSLTICNQFGMNPFHTNFSLSDYFMKFGHNFCMLCCGFLFIGLGMGIGQQILSSAELAVLRQSYALKVFVMTILFMGIFAMVGAEITLTVGLAWFGGAMLAGMLARFIPSLHLGYNY